MTDAVIEVTRVEIDYPRDQTVIVGQPNDGIRVHGTVETVPPAGVVQVVLFVKVYPGKSFETLGDVPTNPNDDDLDGSIELRPDPNGVWSCDDVGPVGASEQGVESQVVVWAYAPTAGVAVTALSNFTAQSLRLPLAVAGPPMISFPANGSVGYPVNNPPGSTCPPGTTCTISASGSLIGPPRTAVYAIVVRGKPYIPGTIPLNPLMGSTKIYSTASGGWACGTVRGAAGSFAAPFPQNQLLVWAYMGGTYSSSLSNFTGRCTN